MHSFTVYYSTPFDVPAPYSYQVSFEIILNENNLNVAFEMNYSNRDGLDEDEILNEGFTMDDNFAWKGDLDMVWANTLDDLMTRTEKRMNLHDQEIIIKEKYNFKINGLLNFNKTSKKASIDNTKMEKNICCI